jgi:hypothetical protein
MNLKHFIILIIIVLIVLVSYLIINKRDQFYFQGSVECEKLNEYGCGIHVANCIVKTDSDSNKYCVDKCRFNPVNPSKENYESYEMVTKPVQGTDVPEYYFENEETNGIFSECFNKCTNINNEKSIPNSSCDSVDCKNICQNYLTHRVEKIGSADVKYMPYPTNRLEQINYDTLKDTIVTQMVGNFKENIQDTIFQDSINTEISEQVNLQEESTKLNNVISVLKNLNSTGNNFIQQVDQLGEFQDKYSQKIEELLEEKKNTDTNLDMKIDSLQNKLEELNKYYQLFNSDVNTNKSDQINKIYKSVKCLANGISLNIVPVYYRKDDNSLANYRNGVYCLTLTQTGGDTGYLYVEPKKEDPQDSTRMLYCNPYDTGCSYKLSLQGATRDNTGPTQDASNILEIDLQQNENILTPRYTNNEQYTPLDYQFKRQGYFHVREIKSNDDYNSILISTPTGTNNLIKNEQIKYPFFVIESLEKPGFLINVSRNPTANGFVLSLNPANKGGTEKYSVSSNNHSDTNNCTP